jgi:ectoine hydroxylase-related dioxygenase (phytanoyl-CoA dioxygenase family)
LERGFAIVPNALPADLVDAMAKDADAAMEPVEYVDFYGGSCRRANGLLGKSPAMVGIIDFPLVNRLADRLLLPHCQDVLLSGTAAFEVSRGGGEQPLHRDESMYYPYIARTPDGPEYFINTMVAVTDFTIENGATRLIPGSHLWPADRLPKADDTIERLVMPRGSLGIWLGSTFHGLGINYTDTPRTGVSIGFQVGWLRQHENTTLVAPPAIARHFPIRVQELTGYKPHGGVIGLAGWKNPMELL